MKNIFIIKLLIYLVGLFYSVYFLIFFVLLKEKGMPWSDPATFVLSGLFLAPFLVFYRANIADKKTMFSFFTGILMSVIVSLCAFQQFRESGLLTIWREEKDFMDFYLSLEKNENIKNLSRIRKPKGCYILFGTIKSNEDIDILNKEIKSKNIYCVCQFVVEEVGEK